MRRVVPDDDGGDDEQMSLPNIVIAVNLSWYLYSGEESKNNVRPDSSKAGKVKRASRLRVDRLWLTWFRVSIYLVGVCRVACRLILNLCRYVVSRSLTRSIVRA